MKSFLSVKRRHKMEKIEKSRNKNFEPRVEMTTRNYELRQIQILSRED